MRALPVLGAGALRLRGVWITRVMLARYRRLPDSLQLARLGL